MNRSSAPQFVVGMICVTDVKRSMEFYQQLGFEVENTFENDCGVCWAWMQRGRACLMLALREKVGETKDASFYVYVPNVAEYRAEVITRGISASELDFPFWSPEGEFEVKDPDGWTLRFALARDLEFESDREEAELA